MLYPPTSLSTNSIILTELSYYHDSYILSSAIADRGTCRVKLAYSLAIILLLRAPPTTREYSTPSFLIKTTDSDGLKKGINCQPRLTIAVYYV